MAKYKVKEGIIVHNGKRYARDEEIDLTPTQADRLEKYIYSKESSKAKEKSDTTPLSDMTVDELKALAESKGLDVVGTGKGGSVKKVDLVNALI